MPQNSSNVIGSGILAIPASGSVLVEVHAPTTGEPQAQFVVSNTQASGGNAIYITDTQGREALLIPAQQAVTLETDSPFKIKGTAGDTYILGQLTVRGLFNIASAGRGRSALGGGGSGSENPPTNPTGPRNQYLA